MLPGPIVLLVGEVADERLNIADLCALFGWTVKPVKSLDDVPRAERPWVIAGFTDASYDGGEALAEWRRRFPRAFWVACCRFGSPGEWQEIDRGIAPPRSGRACTSSTARSRSGPSPPPPSRDPVRR
jgi:hypothetical protein